MMAGRITIVVVVIPSVARKDGKEERRRRKEVRKGTPTPRPPETGKEVIKETGRNPLRGNQTGAVRNPSRTHVRRRVILASARLSLTS